MDAELKNLQIDRNQCRFRNVQFQLFHDTSKTESGLAGDVNREYGPDRVNQRWLRRLGGTFVIQSTSDKLANRPINHKCSEKDAQNNSKGSLVSHCKCKHTGNATSDG